MKLTQLEYTLPKELIANSPVTPRDAAKLLVLNRNTGKTIHTHFYDLPSLLTPNDVLVFNQTKVFPARLRCTSSKQARNIEILLLNETSNSIWTAMHKGKVQIGEELSFGEVSATVTSKNGYEIVLQFSEPREKVLQFIEKKGEIPLPPYIHSNESREKLKEEYQTVYAKENGSVAAPTAGLHFTESLISSIKDKGIETEFVTLHVGAGTFLPIKSDNLEKHSMHSEKFILDRDVADRLNEAKKKGKRIIAVGTTTTRVLESQVNIGFLRSGSGSTNIFIYPPYKFKFVDALITNFHLPHSTLLALVSAFVSKPNTNEQFTSFKESSVGKAYEEAINKNYRFYSFGDAMFIY